MERYRLYFARFPTKEGIFFGPYYQAVHGLSLIALFLKHVHKYTVGPIAQSE